MTMWKDAFEAYKKAQFTNKPDNKANPEELSEEKTTFHIVAFLESHNGVNDHLTLPERLIASELRLADQQAKIKKLEKDIEKLKKNESNNKLQQGRNKSNNDNNQSN